MSRKGFVVGYGENKTLLVKEPSEEEKIDEESWTDVALRGSTEAVLKYLTEKNIHKLSLNNIYWRCSGLSKKIPHNSNFVCFQMTNSGLN